MIEALPALPQGKLQEGQRATVTAAEASFIAFYRDLFNGHLPATPEAEFRGFSPTGLSCFQRGLVARAVRFLVEKGGALGGQRLQGERRQFAHFWETDAIELRFSRRLFQLLREFPRQGWEQPLPPLEKELARDAAPTAGDEVIVLMLADACLRLGRRSQANSVVERGSFIRLLFVEAGHPPLALAADPALAHVAFALRPWSLERFEAGWLWVIGAGSIETLRERHVRFGASLHVLLAWIESQQRFELLEPIVSFLGRLTTQERWVAATLSRIDGLAGATNDLDRSKAYTGFADAFSWATSLLELKRRASRASAYDDDYDVLRFALANLSLLSPRVEQRLNELLGELRLAV
jgi:hypothetical protein